MKKCFIKNGFVILWRVNWILKINSDKMRHRFITSAVVLFSALLILASCGSSRPTTTKRYPYPGSPYPEDRYPQRYPYPDRYPSERYPDYGSTRYPRNLPPGHAKKVYGSRSARPYAKGQQKKYEGNNRDYQKYDKYSKKKRKNRYDDDDDDRRNRKSK